MNHSTTRHPDAIHIGLYRAGSTMLRSYLSQHPDIEWTRHSAPICQSGWQKIPAFDEQKIEAKCYIDVFEGMVSGKITDRQEEWSQTAFTPGLDMIPEFLPDSNTTATRISQIFPQTKITLILREQSSWITSCYLHFLNNMPANQKSFSDFISTRQGKTVLSTANYHEIIETYQDIIGKDNLYVMLFEELTTETDRTLAEYSNFLGLDPVPFVLDEISQNKSIEKTYARDLIGSHGKIDFLARRLLRKIQVGQKRNERFLPQNTVQQIKSTYATSNVRTSELTGLDLKSNGYGI